jgi:hypothetical protein
MIAWLVGSLLGLLVLGFIANAAYLGPLTEKDALIKKQRDTFNANKKLIDGRSKIAKDWKALQERGLSSDASASAYTLMSKVWDIGYEQGFSITALTNPGRTSSKSDFDTIKFQATGTGTTKRVANFLLALESTDLPLKIEDLNITSKTPGDDMLTVEMGLTSIIYAPKVAAGSTALASGARPSTRSATQPATTGPMSRGPSTTGPSNLSLEARLRNRRSAETSEPIPVPIAAPDATPEEIAAAMRARREREDMATAVETRPATQPNGGAQ